jgi:integrase
MGDLAPERQGPQLARQVLDRLSRRQDGSPAAGSTATRKRATFNNAMEYTCERRVLPVNPLTLVKWTRPRVAQTIDLRGGANPDQARRLLDALRCQGKRGERMVAFFAVMYYAALRPEEAVDLRRDALVRGTAWPSCCASTPSAWPVRRRTPSAESAKRPGQRRHRTSARIRHRRP